MFTTSLQGGCYYVLHVMFYTWETRDLEKLSKMPKVTELAGGEVRIDPASFEITFHALFTTTCI